MIIKKSIRINLLIISLLLGIIVLSGCATTNIKDLKNDDYVGETVTVYGTVESTIKLGELSGFTISDETDSIGVSSEDLPEEGNKIRVSGTLMKNILLGYYIES